MNEYAVQALKSQLELVREARTQTASREANWLDAGMRERQIRYQLDEKINGLKSAIVELGGTVEEVAA